MGTPADALKESQSHHLTVQTRLPAVSHHHRVAALACLSHTCHVLCTTSYRGDACLYVGHVPVPPRGGPGIPRSRLPCLTEHHRFLKWARLFARLTHVRCHPVVAWRPCSRTSCVPVPTRGDAGGLFSHLPRSSTATWLHGDACLHTSRVPAMPWVSEGSPLFSPAVSR